MTLVIKRFTFILLIALCFGVTATAEPSKNTNQNSAQNTNGNANAVTGQSAVPQIENKANSTKSTENQEREARDETFRANQAQQNETIARATWLIMIFSGISAFVAAVYAVISFFQWRQNQHFFDMTERPSLGMIGEMSWGKDPFTGEMFVEATLRNSGKSPAVNVIAGITTGFAIGTAPPDDVCPNPKEGEWIGMESRNVVAIGGDTFLSSKNLAIEDFKLVYTGKAQFFIWVHATYCKTPDQRKPYVFENYSRYKADTGTFSVCNTHNNAT